MNRNKPDTFNLLLQRFLRLQPSLRDKIKTKINLLNWETRPKRENLNKCPLLWSESKQQSPRSTCESLKCGADEQRAHGRVRIGCDGGDGCAGLSDLQAEELPLQQAQVVVYLIQQNHAFILFLKDGSNNKQCISVNGK